MISSFRNFAKTKFAGLLVFIMIIPFVFWGMGSMFSSGNTNTIAKINKTNISTQEFVDYLNRSGIPQAKIRENLDKNILEELLSSLVSTTLIDLEVSDYDLIISETTLLKKIKENKNFLDENDQSAPQFEQRLKKRELQKNLFDYIGAGTFSPQFLVNKLFEEENKKIEIDFINLKTFYKKKEEFQDGDLIKFIDENKDQLKVEYLDFKYAIINPKNLLGVNEFNQSYFDKIDQIEIDLANGLEFETIIESFDIKPIEKKKFRYSENANDVEKKIFNLRDINFDIFEDGDNYVLYIIEKVDQKKPDISDPETKDEILELISQKNKFDYNRKLFEKIRDKKFNETDFATMGQNKIQTIKLDSIKDNNKFEINSVEILYSLPINAFTLINDEQNNIYIAKIKKIEKKIIDNNDNKIKEYNSKLNSNIKNSMLKSYDLYLNNKYNVTLNQKTIERVKNFFQ